MGNYKNLNNEEAIAKLKKLAEDIKVCMFCTELTKAPFSTRPMNLQEVDAAGNLWFISGVDSDKNFEIKQDDKVQLLFAKLSSSEYLNIYGHAHIYTDQSTIEEKWSPMAKAWFKDGKKDPNVSIIRVQPEYVYYWDTKDGMMVSLLKIAVAAVTGKQMDGSIEGKISV